MGLEGYARFALALVFVLALIGLAAGVARRFGFGTPMVKGRRDGRRLALVEVMAIDARRRLVLLRRDGTEHLVLLGAGSEVVVETGIVPPAPEIAPRESHS